MQEKISIIVAVYNIEECISKCVESLLCQSYENLEIILVDDGSKDKSGEICDLYVKDGVKVIHKKNGGLSSARNRGLDEATGDYIMFVDGDDYIDKDMCLKLYNCLKENSADMAMCSINNVYEDLSPVSEFNDASPFKTGVFSKEELYRALVMAGNWYYIVMWNKLFKKDIFINLRFPEGKIHEDEFLIHEIISQCEKTAITEERLYFYVQRKGSITNKKYSPKRLDIMEALFARAYFYMEKGVQDEIITKHIVALVKVLWDTYEKADYGDDAFKTRYKSIHKDCRKLIKKALKYKMPPLYRAFLLLSLISVRLTYKIAHKITNS